MAVASKVYFIFLIIWSVVMLIWGLAGFFEYFTGIKPIIELQNKAYPSAVQFVHWLLISLAGFMFLMGYLNYWKFTPFAMLVLFSNLAILCTIESFDFMSEQWSLKAYSTELIFYLATSIFLLNSAVSKSHFIS
jgi:hypothetical protein